MHWANEQSLPEYSDDEDEGFRFDDGSNPMHARSTRAHPQSGNPPHEPKAEGKGHEQTKNEWLKEQDCVAFEVTGVCPEQDSCRMRHRSGASITKGLEKKKPGGRGNGPIKGGKGGKGSKGGKSGKGGKGPPPQCYQYRSEGGCAYGEECRFSHGQEKAMHMRIRDTRVQPSPPAQAPEPVPLDTQMAPTQAPQATSADDHAHAAPHSSDDRPHGRTCPSPRQPDPTMLTVKAHPARVAATDLGQTATNPHTPAPCATMITASGGSRQAPVAPLRPHSPSPWLPEINPDIEAYVENINFDTAADVGLTSNYSLLHQPRACHQVIQGIGDTRVVYTHEGLVIIQPKRHGPAIAIRTLFKPGPPLTLIPGHLLGQDGWSFEGVNQTLHLKHQGEVQGDFPRATVSGAGALLHNQYPLPDRVIQWPASEPVLFPGAKQEPLRPVHLNHREADLMSCALHHAQVEWCQILCPPPWDIVAGFPAELLLVIMIEKVNAVRLPPLSWVGDRGG